MKKGILRYQNGATAVEFAFVLPILLMLVYGTIVYGYLFVVRESIEFAAHKGVEAAIAVDPSATGAAATQASEACKASSSALYWLTASATGCGSDSTRVKIVYTPCAGASGSCSVGYAQVKVTYLVNNGTWVFPQISLPGIGAIPAMPQTMAATAIAKLTT